MQTKLLQIVLLWSTLSAAALAAPGDGGGIPGTIPGAAAPQNVAGPVMQAEKLIRTAQAADPAERQEATVEARRLLEEFLQRNPTHVDMPRAEMWMGVLNTMDGKAAAALAAEEKPNSAKRQAQLDAARKLLREADRRFSTSVDRYASQLRELPSFVPPDTPEHQARETLKGSFLQARMYHAGVVEELAAVYPADSDEARQLYTAAAERYELIYREYRTLYAGLMARLKEGQCYRSLGNPKRALGLYNDILSQPAEIEGLRRLRIASMYLSLECWNMPQEKLHELALSQGELFLKQQRPEEAAWPEWQAVRYHTARGYYMAAELLPEGSVDRDDFLGQARSHASALQKVAGPYRDAARQLAAEIDRPPAP